VNPPRILFLFNHDAGHQAAHVASILAATALAGTAHVIAAYATSGQRAVTERLIGAKASRAIEWRSIALPRALDALLAPLARVAPVRRLVRLDRALDLIASADIVVSPERTCLRAKRKLGRRAPTFVFVPHGAGDRGVTYHPALAGFDHMLVSGQKVVDEMIAHQLSTADRCHIIGYPKFDTIDPSTGTRWFDNDRPTIVYNPHFDPVLSSWYDHGPELLRWFARGDCPFNLVFAPHVMLFAKRFHISPEYRRGRRRPGIPTEAIEAGNILIDTGSERLFDMSYTRAADIYVGDVSSQVYEFLSHRGACYFIDARKGAARAERYQFWDNGRVVRSIGELTAALPDWRADAAAFAAVQERLFAYTFSIDLQRSAGRRGADALSHIAASLA
jgi:hypothetical protein